MVRSLAQINFSRSHALTMPSDRSPRTAITQARRAKNSMATQSKSLKSGAPLSPTQSLSSYTWFKIISSHGTVGESVLDRLHAGFREAPAAATFLSEAFSSTRDCSDMLRLGGGVDLVLTLLKAHWYQFLCRLLLGVIFSECGSV